MNGGNQTLAPLAPLELDSPTLGDCAAASDLDGQRRRRLQGQKLSDLFGRRRAVRVERRLHGDERELPVVPRRAGRQLLSAGRKTAIDGPANGPVQTISAPDELRPGLVRERGRQLSEG